MEGDVNDFLVTTNKGLFLVREGKPTHILEGDLYGLTWNAKNIFLANYEAKVLTWENEKTIKNMEKVPFNFRMDDIHQILWWHGSLYVVHTAYNRIDVWENEERVFSYQWHPFKTKGEQSAQHINSIWCNHSNFYIVEHNRGKVPVCVRVFDLKFKEVNCYLFNNIQTIHNNGLHNVYIENDILYTLSVNNLIMRNLNTQQDEVLDIRSHNDIGYLRGFARDNNYFYIGESRVSLKEDRRTGNSNIIILNNNYKIVSTIELKNSGQLNDIRLLKNDFAHNSIECPKKTFSNNIKVSSDDKSSKLQKSKTIGDIIFDIADIKGSFTKRLEKLEARVKELKITTTPDDTEIMRNLAIIKDRLTKRVDKLESRVKEFEITIPFDDTEITKNLAIIKDRLIKKIEKLEAANKAIPLADIPARYKITLPKISIDLTPIKKKSRIFYDTVQNNRKALQRRLGSFQDVIKKKLEAVYATMQNSKKSLEKQIQRWKIQKDVKDEPASILPEVEEVIVLPEVEELKTDSWINEVGHKLVSVKKDSNKELVYNETIDEYFIIQDNRRVYGTRIRDYALRDYEIMY